MISKQERPLPSETKADCYSAGERASMAWWQGLRGRALAPVLWVLDWCRVPPDLLTLLSLVAGVGFCPLWFWSKPLAFSALALHLLLDGLDGPLARYQGVASHRGSLADTMSDQIVVVATTLTLMSGQTIGVFAGGLYVFLYTVVVMFAMVRNVLGMPYSWLLRPRLYIYAWFLVEMYAFPGTIDYVLWAFNALLAVKMLTGFAQIRQKI